MKRNYSVHEDSVGLVIEGVYYDIHNDYKIENIKFSLKEKILSIAFERGGQSGKLSGAACLNLEFQGVDHLVIDSHSLEGLSGNVAEIGYKEPGDCDMDWIIGGKKRGVIVIL